MVKKNKLSVQKKKLLKQQSSSNGPSDDCNCSMCVFVKSHAPGDSYDLKNCPKCNS